MEDCLKRISEWKTIETAPRDGTVIQLFCDGLVGMGKFLISAPDVINGSVWEGWQFMSPLEKAQGFRFHPTHWMPLPQPPKQKEPPHE